MKNEMRRELKKETCRLSVYEQNVLLPILIKGLEIKKGKQNAVTNKQIVQSLRGHGLKINQRSVCRLINNIRMNDLVEGLMASPKGYYISEDEREFMDYEVSLLGREMAIRRVRMSIQRQRKTMFSKCSQKQRYLF